jgi:glutamine amidotransferase
MCRFLAYSGPPTLMQNLLLDSSYSLVRQSRHSRMRFEPVNGDGFGVGWYPQHDDTTPGTFVSIEPAWSNRNLRQLASKIQTRHFFAHVRDATPGMPVSQANCHPFQYCEWLWMHNGFLGQFDKCRRSFLSVLSDASFNMIRGNTDSEHAFALFLDEIGHNYNGGIYQADAAHIVDAIGNTLRRIQKIRQVAGCDTEAHMNFAVTNGRTSLFTRYSSHGDRPPPTLFYNCEDDTCIIASEPLSESANWTPVDAGQVLVLEEGRPLDLRALEI